MPNTRPLFHEFLRHYPSTWDMGREDLFKSIGWEDLLDNAAYINTCAIRLSIGLLGAKVPLKGRMRVNKGKFAGMMIEPGQRYLSNWLKEYWGNPEIYNASTVGYVRNRAGIISHFAIDPSSPIAQGHIDVLSPEAGDPFRCASLCHWKARTTWFWSLPLGAGTAPISG